MIRFEFLEIRKIGILIASLALLSWTPGCPEPEDDDDAADDDAADDDTSDDDTSGDDDTSSDDDTSGDDDTTGDDDTSGDDDSGDDDTSTSGNDISIDFVAAAPYSYDHAMGGGAFDDRTIGDYDDVVESLQGGEFFCGDVVTYLAEIEVSDPIGANHLTLEMEYRFAANSSGQPGVGHILVNLVMANYGVVSGGDGPGGIDSGNVDDGGSTATLVSQVFDPPKTTPFSGADEIILITHIDDLEPGEHVILRIDTILGCQTGAEPTGNLQAMLAEGRIIAANGNPPKPVQVITGGSQTIPFQQVGDLGGLD